MKKSRIFQLVLIVLVFLLGAWFLNSDSAPTESTSEYVPPSP